MSSENAPHDGTPIAAIHKLVDDVLGGPAAATNDAVLLAHHVRTMLIERVGLWEQCGQLVNSPFVAPPLIGVVDGSYDAWRGHMQAVSGELHKRSHGLTSLVQPPKPVTHGRKDFVDLVQGLCDVLEYVFNSSSCDQLELINFDRVELRGRLLSLIKRVEGIRTRKAQ